MAEANYVETVAQQDVISELLDKSFAARTVCKQKVILQHKKPLPMLRVRTGNRIFKREWYANKEWLCGSILFYVVHIILHCIYSSSKKQFIIF